MTDPDRPWRQQTRSSSAADRTARNRPRYPPRPPGAPAAQPHGTGDALVAVVSAASSASVEADMATTGLAHMAKQAGFEAVGLTGGYSPAPHSRGARRRRSATISTR
jgi:hypothetical protein